MATNKIVKEFKEFAIKGNMIELAVGVIIGTAFNKIVTSLVNDIITPPISLLLGRVDFSNLFVALSRRHFDTLAQAKAAGVSTITYGTFINTLIEFIIVAFVIFFVVRMINRLRREPSKEPDEKQCQFCMTDIPRAAVRCPNCTSQLV